MDPRVVVFEGSETNKQLTDMLSDVFDAGWSSGKVILVTPNLLSEQFKPLKKVLNEWSNGDNLDLEVLFSTKLDDHNDYNVSDRWPLGWDDGNQIFLYVFTKEFMDCRPDARTVLESQVIPWILH